MCALFNSSDRSFSHQLTSLELELETTQGRRRRERRLLRTTAVCSERCEFRGPSQLPTLSMVGQLGSSLALKPGIVSAGWSPNSDTFLLDLVYTCSLNQPRVGGENRRDGWSPGASSHPQCGRTHVLVCRTAGTKYHKLGGLEHQICTLSQLQRPDIWNQDVGKAMLSRRSWGRVCSRPLSL